MKTIAIFSLALALNSNLLFSFPSNGGVAEYIVQSGDTLSQIAEKHHLSTAILQHINLIKDPNAIRMDAKLFIPSLNWLVEPFLGPGEKPYEGNIRVGWLNRTNLVIGLDVVSTNDSTRFLLVGLAATNRTLLFNSEQFSYSTSSMSISSNAPSSWSLKDLDGDGDSDLLCEHVEGSGCFLTLFAFHFDGHKYNQHLLVDDIPIGAVEHHRNRDGFAVIDIFERETGKHIALDWQTMRSSQSLPPSGITTNRAPLGNQ